MMSRCTNMETYSQYFEVLHEVSLYFLVCKKKCLLLSWCCFCREYTIYNLCRWRHRQFKAANQDGMAKPSWCRGGRSVWCTYHHLAKQCSGFSYCTMPTEALRSRCKGSGILLNEPTASSRQAGGGRLLVIPVVQYEVVEALSAWRTIWYLSVSDFYGIPGAIFNELLFYLNHFNIEKHVYTFRTNSISSSIILVRVLVARRGIAVEFGFWQKACSHWMMDLSDREELPQLSQLNHSQN